MSHVYHNGQNVERFPSSIGEPFEPILDVELGMVQVDKDLLIPMSHFRSFKTATAYMTPESVQAMPASPVAVIPEAQQKQRKAKPRGE